MSNEADFVISSFFELVNNKAFTPSRVGACLAIPRFKPEILVKICSQAQFILKFSPTVLHISSPIVVVGDLHGSLGDLLRIIKTCGDPKNTQYLFLGDYVDRGDYSIEVMTLILAIFIKYPTRIHLLRGNHEFADVNGIYGFNKEIMNTYGDDWQPIFENFNFVFNYLPLAAIMDEDIFCVHGGLSKGLETVAQIAQIVKPIVDTSDPMIESILWSDPNQSVNGFVESHRGKGFLFGNKAINKFFENNNLKCMIRGHQCEANGVRSEFDSKVFTVFSSSSYGTNGDNLAGVLQILQPGFSKVTRYEPFGKIPRDNANFVPKDIDQFFKPMPFLRTKVRRYTTHNYPFKQLGPSKLIMAKQSQVSQSANRTKSLCIHTAKSFLINPSSSTALPHYLHLVELKDLSNCEVDPIEYVK